MEPLLPLEIWFWIGKGLGPRDIVRLSAVSRQFYHIAHAIARRAIIAVKPARVAAWIERDPARWAFRTRIVVHAPVRIAGIMIGAGPTRQNVGPGDRISLPALGELAARADSAVLLTSAFMADDRVTSVPAGVDWSVLVGLLDADGQISTTHTSVNHRYDLRDIVEIGDRILPVPLSVDGLNANTSTEAKNARHQMLAMFTLGL